MIRPNHVSDSTYKKHSFKKIMTLYGRICGRITDAFRKLFIKKMKIVVLGLKDAGKTCLVSRVFENVFPENTNQIRAKIKKYTINNIDFVVYDVSGGPQNYSQWDYFYKKCDAMIYCIDSTCNDSDSAEAKKQLNNVLYRNIWRRRPLLVIGNKNDVPDAKGCTDIVLELNLESIVDREIACYSVSALTGTNVDLVIEWLTIQSDEIGKYK